MVRCTTGCRHDVVSRIILLFTGSPRILQRAKLVHFNTLYIGHKILGHLASARSSAHNALFSFRYFLDLPYLLLNSNDIASHDDIDPVSFRFIW